MSVPLSAADDIDRLADPSENLFGNAAEEGMADRSFPVRPHDDRVAAEFIRLFRISVAGSPSTMWIRRPASGSPDRL